MRSILWHRLMGVACAWAVGTAALAAPAAGEPVVPRRPRAMNLFASAGLLLEVNRIQCGLTSKGEVCVAFAGSPVGGGGFWPKGTPDQYIFSSGLQIAGLVSPAAGFPWAGDTTGAYFFDAQGDQDMGDPLQPVYNYLNPSDVAAWPNGAVVRDTSLYRSVLLGRNAISQGDAWTRYWEGNPLFLNGRTHPLGILVDQRALAWNYPSGNEDIIYFVFTFYNISSRTRGTYTNATIPPEIQDEIHAAGVEFQRINEARFNIEIPDAGYTQTDVYAAFAMDADVAFSGRNYASAFLPFGIGTIYTGDWLGSPGWVFPPDIFSAPDFAAAPGFIGVKYLRAPSPLGLTMFSQTYNPNNAIFDDATGVNQLYRYLSGYMGGSDKPCNPFPTYAIARARRLCYLGQTRGDARFYQASGPFDLAPGEARTIVVAYIQAAPTAAVAPYIGGDLPPGIPFTGDSIFFDRTKIRPLERIAGWVSESDENGDQIIQQSEVTTTPRSLLNKALVAQAVYDNKFLLPFAPTAPEFYLVPGDDQVTVVWQRSGTETAGDPFYDIASVPLDALGNPNPLYDPNFRRLDVEGYRVYRGRTASQLELVAQFDYAGRTFKDYTGAIDYGDTDGDGANECAPELGLNDTVPTGDCPIIFDTIAPFTDSAEVDLIGHVIQIPPGARAELAVGGTINLRADTAVTGGASGFPALRDNGVPFTFVDRDVRNSFGYVYTVTAFDVNSLKSTPSSLESPRVTKPVTPRKPASNIALARLTSGVFGDDATVLDPAPDPAWTIDTTTGRFPGPPPPSAVTQLAGAFAPLAEQLLPTLDLQMVIDSVIPRNGGDFLCGPLENTQGLCWEFFVTFSRGATSSSFRTTVGWPIWEGFEANSAVDALATTEALLGGFPVAADSASAVRFGIPNNFAQFNASVQATMTRYIRYSAHENQGGRRLLGAVSPGGSRWFEGANETLDHPTYSQRVGRLTGVDTIYAPLSHIDINPSLAGVQTYTIAFADGGTGNAISTNMQCFPYVVSPMGRQADIEVTWGAGGTISTVRDITHHVNVPFRATPQGSYGFIGDANGNGKIDWRDFDRLENVAQALDYIGFCAGTDPGPGNRALLVPQPVITAVSTAGQGLAAPNNTLAGMPTTGTGFGIYINGQRFIFQLTGGTPPAAGTKWTLRTYAGVVDAARTPATTTPGGYSYTPLPGSPAVTGLRVVFSVTDRTAAPAEAATVLDSVHTVPDPYYVTSALETTANRKVLKFVNLPPRAIIRIYSVSGVLVNVLVHDDVGLGGEVSWNLRNRNNQFVASGVYFYHVETPAGNTKVRRFTVVNFAP